MEGRNEITPKNGPFLRRWWLPDDPGNIVGGQPGLAGGTWNLDLLGKLNLPDLSPLPSPNPW